MQFECNSYARAPAALAAPPADPPWTTATRTYQVCDAAAQQCVKHLQTQRQFLQPFEKINYMEKRIVVQST